MIKNIKSWFTSVDGSSGRTLHMEVMLVEGLLNYDTASTIRGEIVFLIAEKFLEENRDTIQKEFLQNSKFADAVYNAIVLKKAGGFYQPNNR